MSDVYGYTCNKLREEKDRKTQFLIWSLVNQLLCHSTFFSSTDIMKFIEKSPQPKKLLADLAQFRLENKTDNNSLVKYAQSVLREP